MIIAILILVACILLFLATKFASKASLGKPKGTKDLNVGVEYRVRLQYVDGDGQHLFLEEQRTEVSKRKVEYFLPSRGIQLLLTKNKTYLWKGNGKGGFVPVEK